MSTNKFKESFKEFQVFIYHIKKGQFRLLLFILLSILFWLGHCLQIHLFFKSVSIDIAYVDTIMIMPIAFIIIPLFLSKLKQNLENSTT